MKHSSQHDIAEILLKLVLNINQSILSIIHQRFQMYNLPLHCQKPLNTENIYIYRREDKSQSLFLQYSTNFKTFVTRVFEDGSRFCLCNAQVTVCYLFGYFRHVQIYTFLVEIYAQEKIFRFQTLPLFPFWRIDGNFFFPGFHSII